MAYRIKHTTAAGTEYTHVDGDTERAFVPRYEGTRGVIVRASGERKVGYNFRAGRKSKHAREAEIRSGLDEHRKEYTHTRGMSRGKTMKHVASIPPELWWSEKAERGPTALRDPKELKRFCADWNLNVSRW